MGKRLVRGAVLVLLTAAVLAGCSSAKKKGAEDVAGGLGGPSEEGLASGSSLDRARHGLAPGDDSQGPLRDIHFDYDSYELDEPSRTVLRANGEWLKDNARAKVEIEGHCDERGTAEYNLALGAKRARAAKDYLVALGVAGDRLSTISYGEELPLCQDHTEDCWQRNRRGHFVVLSE